MDIKEKADLEEAYINLTKPQLEQLLKSFAQGGNKFLNDILKQINAAIEEILNQPVRLKDGKTIRFCDDANFQKVNSLLNKFIEDNWADMSDTALNFQKAILFLNAWPRLGQELEAISKTLIALKEKSTTMDMPKIKQFCEFHKFLYELIADILTEFATFVNDKYKINTYIKNRKPANAEIYGIFKKMNEGAYHDLFDMFNSVVKNAISHPNTKSGIEYKNAYVKFKDIHKEKIYTEEEFALAVHLWIFFASSATILVFKRFNDASKAISDISIEEWGDIGPKVLPIIDKLVKDSTLLPTKIQ